MLKAPWSFVKKAFTIVGLTLGAIQISLGKPIDYELITDIVRWRVKQAEG